MSVVFADTFYWIALANPDDEAHAQASSFTKSGERTLIITGEEILIEFLTFFADKGAYLRRKAVALTRGVFANPSISVIPQTHESFLAGFELYTERPDKGYSLTDCIAMATAREQGIKDILTNDRHFVQEGFRALFRPQRVR